MCPSVENVVSDDFFNSKKSSEKGSAVARVIKVGGGGGAREPEGRSGGMLPQKILKSKGLEMLFPAFSNSYL